VTANGLVRLTDFFEGRTHGGGIVQDRFGRLRSRFTFEMNGQWRNGRFVLEETFRYDSGRDEFRTWTIVPDGVQGFRGTCPACVGEAIGTYHEDMARSRYRFRLPVGAGQMVFDFDDRLYPVSRDKAINRIRFSKWGIAVGDISIFIERQPQPAALEHPLREPEKESVG